MTSCELRLYNGSGHGLVTLDGSAAEPPSRPTFLCRASRHGPLLRDSAQVDWLAGNADVAWKVSGRGTTEAAMVQSLNGTSNVAVSDGAVIGFDLGGAMHELSRRQHPEFRVRPVEEDGLSPATGTFVIANGVATNNDLKLDSQHLHARAPARSICRSAASTTR